MDHLSKYNIPEYTTPQAGLITPEEGHFYFGDYSDGFDFPANKVQPHRHPYFEIFWLPEPSGAFLSDFRTFPLGDSCLIFVSPGQVHGWPGGHELKGFMLAFDEAFFRKGDKSLLRPPLFYEAATSPVLSISDSDNIVALWKQIGSEYQNQSADQVTALQSLLSLLLVQSHRIAQESAAETLTTQTASTRVYQSFIKTLSGDIPEEHLPKHYAQRLHLSADYLSNCVKQHSGHSAGELIRRRISLESKRLLAHSDMTIAEISYYLHFKDPSYFSRFFKRTTDQSPKEFRERALDSA